jgi:acylphosphatase
MRDGERSPLEADSPRALDHSATLGAKPCRGARTLSLAAGNEARMRAMTAAKSNVANMLDDLVNRSRHAGRERQRCFLLKKSGVRQGCRHGGRPRFAARHISVIMRRARNASRRLFGSLTMSKIQAIAATVTGNDQQVGFRAMVMKQAIEFNLAGFAKNDANMVVHFTLQGDQKRIDKALAAIDEGTKRSSNIKVTPAPTAVDPSLKGFSIPGWTSSSRQITTPYNLVFTLRTDDSTLGPDDVKATWHYILQTTLNADDLKKLVRAGDLPATPSPQAS